MSRSLRALMALIATLALAVAVAACGSDNNSSSSTTTGGAQSSDTSASQPAQAIVADPANKGKKITIGSKNFPEQFILGEIYSQALQAAGFDVKKSLDLGAEQIAFRALKSGDVDAYPEYTGTALTSFYKVKVDDVPRDPQQAYDQLKAEAAKDNIVALPQTPFQNTYKVTSTKETAAALGNPKTISELAQKAQGKRLSGFPECRQRTDCLVGLNRTYGWKPKFVSSTGQYADLDAGQADFTMGFSTDGPLSLDKYTTYEDDKSLFPPYFVTLLTRNDANDRLGDKGRAVIDAVQKPLTEQVMQELNARVSVDKQEPSKVAADYLREAGFVK